MNLPRLTNPRDSKAKKPSALVDQETPAAIPQIKRKTVPDRKSAFLAAYAEGLSIRAAAKVARIRRATHYDWLAADAEYVARFGAVKEQSDGALEDEAVERATVGVFEPNIFQGRFVYPQEEYEIEPAIRDRRGRIVTPARTAWRDKPGAAPFGIWRKSDTLLMFVMRARMPEKYGFRGAMELSGPGGGAIEIVERLQAARRRLASMAGESDAGDLLRT
jgi:hypothetical protein